MVLARGRFCYSGLYEGLPPDMQHKGRHQPHIYNRTGHLSDDDDSSDDEHPERRARRRERRAGRREKKFQRKEQRQDFMCATVGKWRLIVVHKPAIIV